MNVEKAIGLVNLLCRYRTLNEWTEWDWRGQFIPNRLFRQISSSDKTRVYTLKEKYTSRRVELIDPYLCISFQKSLQHRSLLWNIRHFEKLQSKPKSPRNPHLPHLFKFGNQYVIWNGNHRMTAALLLDRRRVKCVVFAYVPRKKPGNGRK